MTEPNDSDLIALATPYALHAMPEAELADIDSRIAAEIVLDPPKEMESRTGGRALIVTFRRSAT